MLHATSLHRQTQRLLFRAIKPTLILCSLVTATVYANNHTEADPQKPELEHIVVTAEKRHAGLLDIATSLSALTGDVLADAGIESITELSQYIPNLHIFNWGGHRDSNIFIRGIGPGLFTDPTVGFYVDGVNYSNNGMFDMDLMNIERIEVLRGPQGTLYGGNSLGGVINVVTQLPSNQAKGRISLTADNLSQYKLTSSASTPLKEDTLFFGLALSLLDSNGYINNTFLNKDFGAREDISARGKLRWQVNNNLEIVLAIDYEKFRGDSYAMGPATTIRSNPDEINHDFEGIDERDSLGTALTLSWSGNNVNFTSITSWRDWENLNSADQDAGSTPGFVFNSMSEEDHQQISQELRLSSKGNKQFNWIAGLYAYSTEFNVGSVNTLDFNAFGMGGPYTDLTDSSREDSGYAAFGQLDIAITDQLTLTTGLRLDHEQRDATVDINTQSSSRVTILSGDRDFNEVLPKIALSYTGPSNDLIYGSISKGYRAGGFDTLYPNPDNPTFDSESSINYELGYKTRSLDGRLEISTALFLIDIDDQQVQQLLPSGTIITDNAAKSRSQGVEFESRFTPVTGWLVSLAGNYTDATFNEYQGVDFATFAPTDYSNNRLPNSPKLTATLSIQNRRPINNQLTLFTQFDTQYIGSYYFDALNQLEQSAYNLLNTRVGVESESWSAYFWVKNALDEYYSKVEFNFGFGPTAEAGEPRAFGITTNVTF